MDFLKSLSVEMNEIYLWFCASNIINAVTEQAISDASLCKEISKNKFFSGL